MAEKYRAAKEGTGEKLSRWGRDFNAIVGAVALAGAAVIPGPNVILATYAGFNLAQAGGFELLRQHAKKKKKRGK